MRAVNTMLDYGGTRADAPCETMLLGRIGRELALIYHDTLQSPLPPRLQELVERLEPESAVQDPRTTAEA
jgi:hypothetical protein